MFNNYLVCVNGWVYTDFPDPDGDDLQLRTFVLIYLRNGTARWIEMGLQRRRGARRVVPGTGRADARCATGIVGGGSIIDGGRFNSVFKIDDAAAVNMSDLTVANGGDEENSPSSPAEG